MHYSIEPIAYINTPFRQKFAIPRQSLALSPAVGEVTFCEHIDASQALEGIEAFSHLWLLFIFHQNIAQGYKAKVRPPRLGGNKKIGVFASRSSFRPNGIGMSLVKNLGLHNGVLKVAGVDLVNNTPIIDIKPYLPYADAIVDARAGYAQHSPDPTLGVSFSPQAAKTLRNIEREYPDLCELITAVLQQDPRPSYKKDKDDSKHYFVQLYHFDIQWHVIGQHAEVIEIKTLAANQSNNEK